MRGIENTNKHVVILVHGIRDFGLWNQEINEVLAAEGFTPEPINYGRFNLLKFLLPFGLFRNRAIDIVVHQVRIIRDDYEGAQFSIIAHSFGTYVIAKLLQTQFEMKFHRIIFCGSVLPVHFPFEQFRNRFQDHILNEVGTKDVWPAVAYSVTFGFGYAGSYGFRRALVKDRWHEGARHNYFLNSEFCRKFWIPFLRSGEIVPGSRERSAQSWPIQALTIIPIKYIFILSLIAATGIYIYKSIQPPPPHPVDNTPTKPPITNTSLTEETPPTPSTLSSKPSIENPPAVEAAASSSTPPNLNFFWKNIVSPDSSVESLKFKIKNDGQEALTNIHITFEADKTTDLQPFAFDFYKSLTIDELVFHLVLL